jgi:hypothetical protein
VIWRSTATDKFSCKGVNRKINNVTKEKYMDVLLTKQSGSGTNIPTGKSWVHLLLPKTESLGRWGLYSTIRDLR